MSILTHLHAYSLYPALTFRKKKALLLNMTRDMPTAMMGVQDRNFLDALKEQGLKAISSPSEWEVCNPKCALTFLKPRFLSDRHTLRVEVSVVEKSSRVADFITVNSWTIDYRGPQTGMDRLRFMAPDTFHSYVVSPMEIRHLRRHFELVEQISLDQPDRFAISNSLNHRF